MLDYTCAASYTCACARSGKELVDAERGGMGRLLLPVATAAQKKPIEIATRLIWGFSGSQTNQPHRCFILARMAPVPVPAPVVPVPVLVIYQR